MFANLAIVVFGALRVKTAGKSTAQPVIALPQICVCMVLAPSLV